MFDRGMRTSGVEQESPLMHPPSFGLVASPALWDRGTEKGLTRPGSRPGNLTSVHA
jgi:hypothetical protein